MKKLCYLLLFLFSFVACKKPVRNSGPVNHPSQGPSIIGKWEWYKTTAFFPVMTPQSSGKSWLMSFFPDSTFKQTGNLMSQSFPDSTGLFSLRVETNSSGLGPGTYIKLISSNILRGNFKYRFISNDTLSLDSGSPWDAPIFYMVRR